MSSWRYHRGTLDSFDGMPWESGPPEKSDGDVVHLFLNATNPANALSTAVLEELRETLSSLEGERGVRALILWSEKPDHFIAGADISEIAELQFAETASAKAAEAQATLDRLSRLGYPTFACLNGTCLGGGLELALACDYRVAVDRPQTKIGLPEINLGLYPGFGGTQRLPRLVGLRSGLALILGATRLPADSARRKGVVDAVIPPEGYPISMLRTVASILGAPEKTRKQRLRRSGGFWNWVLEKNPLGRALVERGARQQVVRKTGGHYPAPLAALEVVIQGFGRSLTEGLALEARRVGPLIVSATCKNLIAVFQDSERSRKLEFLEASQVDDLPPVEGPIGVLGAGVMGAGIASLFAEKGHLVRLRDLQWEPIHLALEHLGSSLDRKVRRRRRTPREREATLDRLTFTTSLTGFQRVGVVVEAIVERMEVKQGALREIEALIPDNAIFASNTSALSITEIARAATHPERVVGLHFFNPVEKMPLVEIIPGEQTDPEVTASIAKLAASVGKYPIVVKDSPGFLVNRLLMPYLDSACRVLERGVPGPWIDQVARSFGLPMGPFALLDEVGLDIAAEVAGTLFEAFGEQARPASLLTRLGELGLRGKKAGKGFYCYDEELPRWNADVTRDLPASRDLPTEENLCHYLLDRVYDEAARCLQEGVVSTPAEVDLAMVMGTGFPPFLGGPLRYADTLGLPSIVERLEERREAGEATQPAELLVRLARSGKTFHSLARCDQLVDAPAG